MKTYLTTSIPYVNAQPHVGFALELVQADAIGRLRRAQGATVRLQTGTDENAFKNVEAARAAGVAPAAWVSAGADQFRRLADDLGVGYDRFLRTTEEAHVRAVRTFWQALRPDDISTRPYAGLYCSGCEDFLFEKDLVDGCCPEHHTAPTAVEETNYFFRLSRYQDDLVRWLGNGDERVCIRPEWRRREILEFVRAGLQDISISRAAARSGGWGITVPGDASQVVYVWIDALINYLSGLGYGTDERWQDTWSRDVRKIHVLGKNVWKFHAVYWPALLLSAGLPLPDELVIHGFLTANGRKIGKSTGNAIAPGRFIERYGAEAVRYFLLRAVPPFADGDFSETRFAAVYESDLVNGLGNLLSRLVTLAVKSGLTHLPAAATPAPETAYLEACREYRHDDALALLWQRIAALNRAIESAKPWEALKAGPSNSVQRSVSSWLQELRGIALHLEPFLPATVRRIERILDADPLAPTSPLFPRVRSAPSDFSSS
jgi:methionyl-tRNA synthetase